MVGVPALQGQVGQGLGNAARCDLLPSASAHRAFEKWFPDPEDVGHGYSRGLPGLQGKGIRLLLGAATAAALTAGSSGEAAQTPGARQPVPPACLSPPHQRTAGGLQASQQGCPRPLPVPLECGLGAVTLPKRMAWEHRKESSVCSTSFLSGKQAGFVKPQWLQDIPGPQAGPTGFNSLVEAFPNRPLSEKTLPRGGPADPLCVHAGSAASQPRWQDEACSDRQGWASSSPGAGCATPPAVRGAERAPAHRSHCVPGEPGLGPRWADAQLLAFSALLLRDYTPTAT